jgi:charged multivesicular body protein 4
MLKLREKLFGGKKKKGDNSNDVIQKLRTMEDLLTRKQEYFEKKIQDEIGVARKHGMANKRAAMQALMRKKRYQKQLQQIDGTLTTIEMQREALEMSHANTSVLETLSAASKALKTAHEHLKVEDVHDIMDDIAEQQEVSKEIAEAISNPVAFSSDIDEEDLEKELEELTQEELEKELLSVTAPSGNSGEDDEGVRQESTPRTSKAAKSKQTEEEEELKELAEWGLS